MTLTDLCDEIKNWFDVSQYTGKFEIKNGTIDLDFLSEGQYFRIVGSVFNDGVYQHPCFELKDEEFDGAIWAMAVPQSVIKVCDEITEFENKYREALNSPYQSESFAGYSYSKANGSDGNISWQNKFRKQLNRWRKV